MSYTQYNKDEWLNYVEPYGDENSAEEKTIRLDNIMLNAMALYVYKYDALSIDDVINSVDGTGDILNRKYEIKSYFEYIISNYSELTVCPSMFDYHITQDRNVVIDSIRVKDKLFDETFDENYNNTYGINILNFYVDTSLGESIPSLGIEDGKKKILLSPIYVDKNSATAFLKNKILLIRDELIKSKKTCEEVISSAVIQEIKGFIGNEIISVVTKDNPLIEIAKVGGDFGKQAIENSTNNLIIDEAINDLENAEELSNYIKAF